MHKKTNEEGFNVISKTALLFSFSISHQNKITLFLKPGFINCLIDIFTLNFSYNYRTKTAWFKLLANDPYIILVIAKVSHLAEDVSVLQGLTQTSKWRKHTDVFINKLYYLKFFCNVIFLQYIISIKISKLA